MERSLITFYTDFITNLLEFLTYIKFFQFYFEPKKKEFYFQNHLIYVVYLIITSSISISYFFTISFIANFIFNKLTYKINYKNNLFYIIKFNLFYYAPYTIIIGLSMLFLDSRLSLTNDFYQNLKSIIICSILYIAFSHKFHKKKANNIIITNPYKKFIYLLLFLMLIIFCSFLFASINLDASKETIQSIIIITFLVNIIMLVLIVSIYEKIIDSLQDSSKNQLKLQKYQMNQIFYDELSYKTKQLSLLKHDFKNHITIIRSWLHQKKYDKLENYLDSIIDYVTYSSDIIITNNQTISSIVQAKKSRCESLKIKLKYNINFEKVYKISDIDLTILLGNILDNAIDAVSIMPNNDNYITLNIKQIKSYLIISCKNPFIEMPIEKNGFLLTTKFEKDIHGLGLTSVLETCSKYNGECKYRYDNNLFYIELMIPNY